MEVRNFAQPVFLGTLDGVGCTFISSRDSFSRGARGGTYDDPFVPFKFPHPDILHSRVYLYPPIPLYLGATQKKAPGSRSCIKTSPDRTVGQRSAHPCKPESSSFDSMVNTKTHALLGINKRHTGIGGYALLRTWPGARRTTNSLSHWTYNLSVRPWSDTRTDSD